MGNNTKRAFDQTMQQITLELDRNPENGIPFLKEQIATYRNQPLGKEVARACARMLWDITPDEQRAGLATVFLDHETSPRSIIDEANRSIQVGRAPKAVKAMKKLIRKYDQLCAHGWGKGDSEHVSLDFRTPLDEAIWRVQSGDSRTVRHQIEPFREAYFVYGVALYSAERFPDSISALMQASRWDPADRATRFAIAENYKKLGNLEEYNRALDEMHPFITTAEDLADYHLSKGSALTELKHFELAAAHITYSLLYVGTKLAFDELAYIKALSGQDYTAMTRETCVELLSESGELCGPDERTIAGMRNYLEKACEDEDYLAAIQTATDLYRLTGDGNMNAIAEDLIEIANALESVLMKHPSFI